MSTDAQIAANQQNAKLSTGPVTPEGKAISSFNSCKNGFRSATILLSTDDPAEYHALVYELCDRFHPEDLEADRFVREMADAEWRLRRTRLLMGNALARRMSQISDKHPDLSPIDLESMAVETMGSKTEGAGHCSWATWLRYETKFERQYERAHRGWVQLCKDRQRANDKIRAQQLVIARQSPRTPELASSVQNAATRVSESALSVQNPASPPPSAAAAPQGKAA